MVQIADADGHGAELCMPELHLLQLYQSPLHSRSDRRSDVRPRILGDIQTLY